MSTAAARHTDVPARHTRAFLRVRSRMYDPLTEIVGLRRTITKLRRAGWVAGILLTVANVAALWVHLQVSDRDGAATVGAQAVICQQMVNAGARLLPGMCTEPRVQRLFIQPSSGTARTPMH